MLNYAWLWPQFLVGRDAAALCNIVCCKTGTGDLIVHINVWTPKKVSKEEKEILEKLKNSANFQPHPGEKDKDFFSKVKDMFQH